MHFLLALAAARTYQAYRRTRHTSTVSGVTEIHRKVRSHLQAQFALTVCRHGAEGALTSLGEALKRLVDDGSRAPWKRSRSDTARGCHATLRLIRRDASARRSLRSQRRRRRSKGHENRGDVA